MSADLLEVCREYDSIIESMLPGRQAFFPNKSMICYNKSVIDYWFHEFWDKLPEARAVTGNSARGSRFSPWVCSAPFEPVG